MMEKDKSTEETERLAFNISNLGNLRTLHEHEEELRAKSLMFIAGDNDHSEMLFLISNALNVLFVFSHDHECRNDDELTLQYLGIRLFNTAGSSMKIALSGYAQQALAQIRDILEVAFLIDYFRTSPEQISAWKAAGDKERKFRPAGIRDALDARDGNKEKKRAKAYATLSGYASHATYSGFV